MTHPNLGLPPVGEGLQPLAVALLFATAAWGLVGPLASSPRANLQLIDLPDFTGWGLLAATLLTGLAALSMSQRLVGLPRLLGSALLGVGIGMGLRLASALTEDANIGGGAAMFVLPVLALIVMMLMADSSIRANREQRRRNDPSTDLSLIHI